MLSSVSQPRPSTSAISLRSPPSKLEWEAVGQALLVVVPLVRDEHEHRLADLFGEAAFLDERGVPHHRKLAQRAKPKVKPQAGQSQATRASSPRHLGRPCTPDGRRTASPHWIDMRGRNSGMTAKALQRRASAVSRVARKAAEALQRIVIQRNTVVMTFRLRSRYDHPPRASHAPRGRTVTPRVAP